MDLIKAQLLRMQQQLSGLSATQKMLTATLVAIMVMTMVWWGRYAGTAEMEPVLDQSLAADDVAQIKMELDAHGISARVVGDRVLVPTERKLEALAMLGYARVLPSDTHSGFDEIMKQLSPWDSAQKSQVVYNRAKEQALARVISGFPKVVKAEVMINPVSERRVGASLEPSASVIITTRGDAHVKRLVDAAAATVASAQSGLSRSRVSVVVDGIPRRSQDPAENGYLGGDLYEQIEQQEKRARDKIIDAIGMPNALVAVTADLDINSSKETSEKYDPAGTVAKEKSIETTNEETAQPPAAGIEPGAAPNTWLALPQQVVAAGPSSTVEKTRTEMEIGMGKSVVTTLKPAGKPTVVAASVRLPRSFFVSEYKAANPNINKEPTEPELQPLVSAELAKVRKAVLMSTGIKSEDAISVDTYFDTLPLLTAAAPAPSGSSPISQALGGHAKEIAVAALAAISLFMVSMIVKKSSPAPAMAAVSEEPAGSPRVAIAEDIAGVVGDGNTTLDGMELDEEAVRSQQIVEQVSTMVKENPDAAANLVKRWLNRS